MKTGPLKAKKLKESELKSLYLLFTLANMGLFITTIFLSL